jgi:hypothetical protein
MILFFFNSRVSTCPKNGCDVANQRDLHYLQKRNLVSKCIFLDKEKIGLLWIIYIIPIFVRCIQFGISPLFFLYIFKIAKIRYLVRRKYKDDEKFFSSCVMLLAINEKDNLPNMYVRHHNSEVEYLKELSKTEIILWKRALIKKSVIPLKKFLDKIYLNKSIHHLFFTQQDLIRTSENSRFIVQSEIFEYRPIVSKIRYDRNPLICVSTILFFGADHAPNIEVATWIENILLEELLKLNHRMDVIVACGGYYTNKYEVGKITFESIEWINDPFDFDLKTTLYLLPSFHGSGVKIKILEALEAGCTVMTNKSAVSGFSADQLIVIPDDKQLASHSVVETLVELEECRLGCDS